MKNGLSKKGLWKVIEFIVTNIISVLVICFTGFLFLQSMFGSAVMDYGENIYFIKDSILLNILIIGAILAVLVGVKIINYKRNITIPMPGRKFLNVFTIIFAVLMVLFVAATHVNPMDDQQIVLDCAKDLLSGEYSQWETGGYCYIYPHQNGIVLFFALISAIFGENNWMAVQILGIPTLVCSAYFASKTIYLLFNDKKLAAYSYIILLLFMPFNFYTTFVYGTVFGMACALAGIYFVIKYFKQGKIANGILGITFVVFSYVFKSNFLILFVAIMLLVLYDIIMKRRIASVITLIYGIVFYLLIGLTVTFITQAITGAKIEDSIPSSAWVAMGMQEGNKAPGWWNGYNRSVAVDNDFDYEKTQEAVKQEINSRLDAFSKDKMYALEFFSKKISSQWNEGTFEAFYIDNIDRGRPVTGWSALIKSLMLDGRTLNKMVVNVSNFFLSLLWLGVLFYMILDRKNMDAYKLIFGIIFIGGFLFHLFWEAKGQYTVVYAYVLIPYMLRGYQNFAGKFVQGTGRKARRKVTFKNSGLVSLISIFAVVLLVGVLNVSVINKSIKLSGDELRYEEYISHQVDDLDDGRYIIYSEQGNNIYLTDGVDSENIAKSKEVVVDGTQIRLYDNDNRTASGKTLSAIEGWTEKTQVAVEDLFRTYNQRWVFENKHDNVYVIKTENGLALTYNAKTKKLSIEKYTGDKNQCWYVLSGQ